jgi:hypothetical protein
MDLSVDAVALAAFERRGAGTDAERRAAGHLRDRLRETGREADVDPIRVRPRWALAQAIAATAVVVGSVTSVSRPGLGAAMVLAAAVSSILEVTGSAHLLLRLTGARASQNVWSPPRASRGRGLLLLVAGYDAPRDAAFLRLARRVRDPWLPICGSMLLVLLCCVLRLLGFAGNGLTGIQFVLTLLPLAAVPLLVDVELSPFAAGEATAAGAATVLSVAEDLEHELRHLDVGIVLTGAQAPFAQGMRAWLRRHRKELDPQRTIVMAVGALGAGGVRYSRREGPWLLSWRTNGDLVRLCEEMTRDDEDGSAFDAAGIVAREPGDAMAAMSRGLPAIGVSTADRDRVDAAAVERAHAFCMELARRVDAELAPRLADEPLRPA